MGPDSTSQQNRLTAAWFTIPPGNSHKGKNQNKTWNTGFRMTGHLGTDHWEKGHGTGRGTHAETCSLHAWESSRTEGERIQAAKTTRQSTREKSILQKELQGAHWTRRLSCLLIRIWRENFQVREEWPESIQREQCPGSAEGYAAYFQQPEQKNS